MLILIRASFIFIIINVNINHVSVDWGMEQLNVYIS